ELADWRLAKSIIAGTFGNIQVTRRLGDKCRKQGQMPCRSMQLWPTATATQSLRSQRCCRSATWSAVEIETTEVLRHEPFAYEFTAPRHLLIASATDRYDGETRVDGLPGSHLRAWNRKMTFVPAGCEFSGWQKPRALCRGAHLCIDPRSSLLQ